MTKLNHKKEQSIVALLHSGMTQVEVAKRYRLARRTIQRVAEKHAIKPVRQMANSTELQCLRMIKAYQFSPDELRKALLFYRSKHPK